MTHVPSRRDVARATSLAHVSSWSPRPSAACRGPRSGSPGQRQPCVISPIALPDFQDRRRRSPRRLPLTSATQTSPFSSAEDLFDVLLLLATPVAAVQTVEDLVSHDVSERGVHRCPSAERKADNILGVRIAVRAQDHVHEARVSHELHLRGRTRPAGDRHAHRGARCPRRVGRSTLSDRSVET